METKHIIACILASAIFSAFSTVALMRYMNAEPSGETDHTALVSRISKLEKKLDREKGARERLQDFVSHRPHTRARNTTHQQEQETESKTRLDPISAAQNQAKPIPDTSQRRPMAAQRDAQRIARAQPEYQINRLVKGGFSQ